jgi:serine/threonine protein kinase
MRSTMREAGETIGGLVLRHKIAEGGMGSIWAAEQVALGREVAVKFLSGAVAHSDGALERFSLEARTLARVQSPHSPQIFDHGVCEDGTPYIVMELIVGTELAEWVAQRGPMSVPQVTRLVKQVSLALTAAHELGVIHRILLSGGDDDFHVKLIDFGIAKSLLSGKRGFVTKVGAAVGTPAYMSPEQLAGSTSVDERTDVWSLGVVTYWCLTQELPYEGEGTSAMYVSILRGQMTPVTELRPELPEALDDWFAQTLARDPEERFQSAAAMSRAFSAATAERYSWQGAIPLVQRAARRRVFPYLVMAAAVGLVVAAGTRVTPATVSTAKTATVHAEVAIRGAVGRAATTVGLAVPASVSGLVSR